MLRKYRCCGRGEGWLRVLTVVAAQTVTNYANATCCAPAKETLDRSVVSETRLRTDKSSVGWDPVLQRKWMLVADSQHPNWPLHMQLLGPTSKDAQGQSAALPRSMGAALDSPVLVRGGDVVTLWKHDGPSRIELRGVSEESGVLGKRIRVRTMAYGVTGLESSRQLLGTVRGPLNVEIQP